MARKASRIDQLVSAHELLKTAKTAEELRSSQAVLLPLELGMSIEQTAKVIGRSVRWTCVASAYATVELLAARKRRLEQNGVCVTVRLSRLSRKHKS